MEHLGGDDRAKRRTARRAWKVAHHDQITTSAGREIDDLASPEVDRLGARLYREDRQSVGALREVSGSLERCSAISAARSPAPIAGHGFEQKDNSPTAGRPVKPERFTVEVTG
jgi:hypothetical protein